MASIFMIQPAAREGLIGNRLTAIQWAGLLGDLGHEVQVAHAYDGQAADVFVVLNGERNHDAVAAIRRKHPDGAIVVAVTGSDIYPEPTPLTLDSVRLADRVVALQSRARDRIPAEFHEKLRIIKQSAEPAAPGEPVADPGPFDVCVVGNLRDVKDPMRAAAASRLLPASSRIRVRHAGAPLDDRYGALIELEQQENPRYVWLGPLAYDAARQLMAQSRLLVASSYHEGGARVVGESVVAGTPVLAARNDATRCLLGDDYPGLYEAGATQELADLMRRAETDPVFMDALLACTRECAAQFDPRLEREAWRALVAELAA